ncbi:MAG: hypothetical protein WBQ50_17735 [Nocardioides sp.]
MISDDGATTRAKERPRRPSTRPSVHPRVLEELLLQQRLVIVDVIAGAGPGTRRLFLGDGRNSGLRLAVSIAHAAGGDEAVAHEAKALTRLDEVLPERLAGSVPQIREWVLGPRESRALVVSAVPGLPSTSQPPRRTASTRQSLDALLDWLGTLWDVTVGPPIGSELGRDPVDLALSRYRGAAKVRPAIGTLLRARGRLAQLEVVSAMTHGCLCAKHVFIGDGRVGVDDWGLATSHGDPLRELGRYAVDMTDHRLPEVFESRTRFAAHVRRGVCSGMELLDAPTKLWRDVLLLAHFEVALTELGRGDASRLSLLHEAVRVLPTST